MADQPEPDLPRAFDETLLEITEMGRDKDSQEEINKAFGAVVAAAFKMGVDVANKACLKASAKGRVKAKKSDSGSEH